MMVTTPKVSVIVPAYNVESYIVDCLESLVVQTLSDFEAIVIDDGSTDETFRAAQELVADDDRFIFIQTVHSGQSAARNRGLDAARGEYVSFLDSDDCYTPDCLNRLVAAAEADRLDGVFFSAESFYDGIGPADSLVENLEHGVRTAGVVSGPDLFEAFEYSEDIWSPVALQLIRRSVIEENHMRFYEGIIHEDELFTATMLPLMNRVSLVPAILYRRRIRPASTMTGSNSSIHMQSLFRVEFEMKRWISAPPVSFERSFLKAFSHRIYWITDVAARYALGEEKSQIHAFADTLTDAEFVDFEMNIVQRSANTKKISDDISQTKAYQLGRVLTFVPERIIDEIRSRSDRR